MKALLVAIAMNLGLLIAVDASAQAPATAPAGSTALCKDGSYSSGTNKRSACRGHKGTKEWFGGAAAATGAATAPETSRKSSRKSKTETATTAAPTTAPAGSTALCKDGSYSSGTNKRSACRGHKGTKEWFGTGAAATTATEAASETARAPARASKNETATASAAAPAGSTALCKDGSYSSGTNKRSACRGHKGTKEWYGAGAAAAATTAAAPSPAATAAPARSTESTSSDQPARTTAAPGGGAGKVWVNSESKVYHCQSDRYYGKTKKGEYMSEADALAKGNRAARGKSCSQ